MENEKCDLIHPNGVKEKKLEEQSIRQPNGKEKNCRDIKVGFTGHAYLAP